MSRTTAIVAGVFVALVLVAMGFAQAPSPAPAFKGRLATQAPLLAVAPAGRRLVIVGEYGVCDQGVDRTGTGAVQQLGGTCQGAAGAGDVVDEHHGASMRIDIR